MMPFSSLSRRQAFGAACAGLTMLVAASAAQAQSAPFAGLNGNWSGTGTVTLSDGTNERIRCRAHYVVDSSGLQLKQSLRCASDSYKFELSSNVVSQGGRVTGSWSEASRNINGDLQGTASGGDIEVFVQANGFAAQLYLNTKGNRQNVSISSKGEIRGVSITLARG